MTRISSRVSDFSQPWLSIHIAPDCNIAFTKSRMPAASSSDEDWLAVCRDSAKSLTGFSGGLVRLWRPDGPANGTECLGVISDHASTARIRHGRKGVSGTA